MAVELRLAPEAQEDIEDAYAWYESRSLGLGESFLSRLDACIQTVLRRPEMASLVHANYRRALVRRFPYSIFYEYAENRVTIYCVCHSSRDPKRWQRRLN